MTLFSKVLDLFRAPDGFDNDPVSWVYSQIGHGWLGVALTTASVWTLFRISGEYPNESTLALLIPLLYLMFWELDVQGWRGWDTLEDSLFVASGSLLFLIIDMSEVIDRLMVWVVLTALALFVGVIRRVPG